MNQKHLEIILSQHVQGFSNPKIELEQYMTPPQVASTLMLFADSNDDIVGKKVLDLCAGTGMLGITAALLGANVTFVEKDEDAVAILVQNLSSLEFDYQPQVIQSDAFSIEGTTYETAVVNPPFGIQQKDKRDIDFVEHAAQLAKNIYSIHDGSPDNLLRLPDLLRARNIIPQGYYEDEFQLQRSYEWHSKKIKIHKIAIFYSISSLL